MYKSSKQSIIDHHKLLKGASHQLSNQDFHKSETALLLKVCALLWRHFTNGEEATLIEASPKIL